MSNMRAIVYAGTGGPEVISLGDVPKPAPGPGQLRVQVRAAGLNRADLLQRRGHYAAPHGWPDHIPGLEYAGVVDVVHPADEPASPWRRGDRVMGLVGGGAMAEYLVVDAAEALPTPEGMSDEDAAAVPESFLTAWDAMVTRGRLRSGERVLIHAVGSGLGTAAVQIAEHLGATAIGTSRSADKLARVAIFGLDQGIDTSRDGNAAFRDLLAEHPVHVILDVLGAPAFADNLAVLAPCGRLILLGFLAGARVDAAEGLDLGPILRKRLEVIGSVMRSRGPAERAALAATFTRDVRPLFEHGVLRPMRERTYPMAELAEAHAAMERNETFGKIVVAW
jgi:putative PIG3 family NAD(P)H quinone oxidoreductase